jgi:Fic family protein
MHPIPEKTIDIIRRQSILKSSLFSARIEGNPLTLPDITRGNQDDKSIHNLEIQNISDAYAYLQQHKAEQLSGDLLTKLHELVMQNISPEAGHYRTVDSAIFNQAGVAVYITPPPVQIRKLIGNLVDWCNSNPTSPPIMAAVCHIWFEKIHPFEDGNGRIGRLLSAFILKKSGYDFGGIVPFEEYLDNHRDAYYDALGRDSQDVTRFVEFFLEALAIQAQKSLKEAASPPEIKHPNLLPRRAEIIEIIGDHTTVTFDFLSRRFLKIPQRTLHYDLEQLVKAGLVKKLGSTRGVVYTLSKKKK